MSEVLTRLGDRGLLMQAVIDVADILPEARSALSDRTIREGDRMVMLGQAGTSFWDHVVRHRLYLEDPFDEASVNVVTEAFEAEFPDARFDIVYPGPMLLPLGSLAQLAGWGYPSPLGLVINDRYGLWTAVRVVALTDAPLEPTLGNGSSRPCPTCAVRSCVTACPAGAVSYEGGFDVTACSSYRVLQDSRCAYRCLAREACPIGSVFRYGTEQMRHHYSSGLEAIKRWSLGDAG